ncbi:2-oxoglutarate dehydrogenase E1 component [Nowakowskiella sp. JEL0407]|nr:2-oxoglutarate dehydrogenase E1 component [Nowakowskiella sp. JEL0407]
MAVLLHGDAAFSGQGVVYETLGFSDLPSYTTGGTIHIVVNNQIGFTTDPRFSRSTPYCSDVAKTVNAPILHVNGDDVEAVVFAMEFASEWRAKFKKDVVIDIICYRKYGHNEIDQPQFTQPLMYRRIAEMKSAADKYIAQLLAEGSITQEEVESNKKRIWDILENSYQESKNYNPSHQEWVASSWTGFKSLMELNNETVPSKPTGVAESLLQHIGMAACAYPPDLQVHSNLAKILKAREKSLKEENGIDWATAESMAFGTLLSEGNHVRLSGQDVERGTFSQRHAVLHDQYTERQYVPLNNLVVADQVARQSQFTVCNSSLSEFGTLGFELGYSMVHPNQLVMWEAQFGNLANNAQCIIDQFICSGEKKWLQRTGLTMLLPHGYDGQGPEHSSARIERFLQLVDEDPYLMPDLKSTEKGSYARQHLDCSVQVVYPTVPSNYFHVLRRQVMREFRKPTPNGTIILERNDARNSIPAINPEVLHPNPLKELELAEVVSDGSLWADNNAEPRIPYALCNSSDAPLEIPGVDVAASPKEFKLLPPNQIKTLIFCSGQVYYALSKARELNDLNHVAIVRVEQLSPFPFWEAKQVIDFYGQSLEEIVWAQEESLNSGSWLHAKKWIEKMEKEGNPGGLSVARKVLQADSDAEFNSIRGSAVIRYAGRDQTAAPATGL